MYNIFIFNTTTVFNIRQAHSLAYEDEQTDYDPGGILV